MRFITRATLTESTAENKMPVRQVRPLYLDSTYCYVPYYSYSFKYYNNPYGKGTERMAKQKTLYDQLLPGQEVFGSFEAADILKVKRSMINNDMKQGYLPAGARIKWGRTVRTVFSRQEMYLISLFYQLHATGLTKRHADEIVRIIGSHPHDYILLKPSADHAEAAAAMHYKNYLSVQALDEIKKTAATIVINYKKIRTDLDKDLWRCSQAGAGP